MSCGFDSLPNQSTTRQMVHGLAFNLLIVGASGIGKTTYLNSLFDFDYGDTPDIDRELDDIKLRIKEYKPKNTILEMKITLIETKGFDNNSCKPIVDYLTARFDDYMKDELSISDNRTNDITDSRVHCCIYMIPPTGLKAIDIVTLKQLHHKVCLILVIAKSDILSKQERYNLKEKIKHEINANKIEVYTSDEIQLPLAIAASNDIIDDNGKRQRARVYPWGRMYIERDSEFSQSREFILKSHMLTLIEHTNHVHYERHREEVINKFKRDNDTPAKPAKPATPNLLRRSSIEIIKNRKGISSLCQ